MKAFAERLPECKGHHPIINGLFSRFFKICWVFGLEYERFLGIKLIPEALVPDDFRAVHKGENSVMSALREYAWL
ncbi:hypothetical protein A6M23_11875 [Acidithiobacillus thiooxidans]|uniref:Uncharacterized protein n=1 Tax=Acidithiobacillus thiooxidans TaxID=930 RepID=A0A1C2I613_ACITH|nr:hypothetical protein A6M23_11875 [Acidithiobacillus thiooxidans]OCX81779.1 hypothetical protein A6P08_13260 [Acidithiobacillus thiooxidans]